MKNHLTPSHLLSKFERDKDFEYPRELNYLETIKRNFRNKVADRKKYARWFYERRLIEIEKVAKFKRETFRAKVSTAIPYSMQRKLWFYKPIPEKFTWSTIILGYKLDVELLNKE